jgi:hypothetical protein
METGVHVTADYMGINAGLLNHQIPTNGCKLISNIEQQLQRFSHKAIGTTINGLKVTLLLILTMTRILQHTQGIKGKIR